MIPFGLLKWRLWTQAYGAIYYNGTILFLVFPMVVPFLRKVLVGKSKDKGGKNTAPANMDVPNGKQD